MILFPIQPKGKNSGRIISRHAFFTHDLHFIDLDILFFYQCQDRVDVRQLIKFQKDVHIFGITNQVPFNIRQKTETDDN